MAGGRKFPPGDQSGSGQTAVTGPEIVANEVIEILEDRSASDSTWRPIVQRKELWSQTGDGCY
jgi:hypothetical protein